MSEALIAHLRKQLEDARAKIALMTPIVDAVRGSMEAEEQHGFGSSLDEAYAAVIRHDAVYYPHEPKLCEDCGVDTVPGKPGQPTEWYMVHNSVWVHAGAATVRYLCIACLEKRLGRELTAADFTDAPCNDPGRGLMSARHLARITASPLPTGSP